LSFQRSSPPGYTAKGVVASSGRPEPAFDITGEENRDLAFFMAPEKRKETECAQ